LVVLEHNIEENCISYCIYLVSQCKLGFFSEDVDYVINLL
jgi:hypothetical protein